MPKLLTLPEAGAHIARANSAAERSPEAFGRAVWLAQSSARVRSERFWPHVSTFFAQFASGVRHPVLDGRPVRELFSLSAKWRGVSANWNARADLWAAVMGAETDAEALAALIREAEWLSTVKGGFVVQLTRGGLGCIDSVNKRLYGLETVTNSPNLYPALCESLGGSVALWAHWCNAVALERGADPVAISRAHADFVASGECEPVEFGGA